MGFLDVRGASGDEMRGGVQLDLISKVVLAW